ncbi:hypothetical protein LX36DRAFT_674047 [Colletotrichum falcatum]|nr:hypothetical protein LX36DRAFT_674047 [Colletotrichum falcatum]
MAWRAAGGPTYEPQQFVDREFMDMVDLSIHNQLLGSSGRNAMLQYAPLQKWFKSPVRMPLDGLAGSPGERLTYLLDPKYTDEKRPANVHGHTGSGKGFPSQLSALFCGVQDFVSNNLTIHNGTTAQGVGACNWNEHIQISSGGTIGGQVWCQQPGGISSGYKRHHRITIHPKHSVHTSTTPP